MFDALPAIALGVWLGISLPLVAHVVTVVLDRLHKGKSKGHSRLSWLIRLVGTPVLLLGVMGVAAAIGTHLQTDKDHISYGLLIGIALYAITAWLYYRTQRSTRADT